MTNVELFCYLYKQSTESTAKAIKLAPTLSQIWSEMSETDRDATQKILALPPASNEDYENA